jgi:two-component system KDP operon response regulator KdpE
MDIVGKPLALVIEDDVDASIIFAGALRAAGYETEIIRQGRAALQRLEARVPDAVVLDLHLPYVSGADILSRIRTDDRLVETRVIITTADPEMANSLHDQADLILIKPISFVQLRDLAARMLPSGSDCAE